ncbi:MAG: sigma-70 family RNA polymerase sigma factor [Mariniblastus sp.]|nr:sigma-70 family RNA polymerase sigma factor [Mariniblastus sp.]
MFLSLAPGKETKAKALLRMSNNPSSAPDLQAAALPPDQWVDQYGDYLYRYAHSRLRDANAAEEVLQETFLAGIRHVDQYAGRGSQRGWLLGILKRKIIDHVRLRAKHAQARSYEDEPDPTLHLFDAQGNWKKDAFRWSPQPDEQIQEVEFRQILQSCLDELPETQRTVFQRSVMDEKDSEEICKELNITPSNLWVRMHRARLGLAKCVETKWLKEKESLGHAE